MSERGGAHYDLVDGNDTGFVLMHIVSSHFSGCHEANIKYRYLPRSILINAYNFMHNHWNYSLYCKCLEDFINKTTMRK